MKNRKPLESVLFFVCALTFAACVRGEGEDAMSKDKTTGNVVRRTRGNNRWFPGNGAQLNAMVKEFMDQANPPKIDGRIVAAIAPHAGYIYSGPTAGWTFRAIRDNATAENAPETVVLLGFSHSEGYPGVALMTGDAVESPIGKTSLDVEAAISLVQSGSRIFLDNPDRTPHDGEHSAENEIPFVQVALPKAKLVVGLIGDHDGATTAELVKALGALAARKKILVVASTDMLHHADYDLVTSTDRATLDLMANMDHKGIMERWSIRKQICCGIKPVEAAMLFAETQGCRKGSVLYYRNSGDDHPESRGSWVVGYGAVVFAVEGK